MSAAADEAVSGGASVMLEALTLIASMQGLTLLDLSLGPDGNRAHQIGANKAFNQCADIARSALAKAQAV